MQIYEHDERTYDTKDHDEETSRLFKKEYSAGGEWSVVVFHTCTEIP